MRAADAVAAGGGVGACTVLPCRSSAVFRAAASSMGSSWGSQPQPVTGQVSLCVAIVNTDASYDQLGLMNNVLMDYVVEELWVLNID